METKSASRQRYFATIFISWMANLGICFHIDGLLAQKYIYATVQLYSGITV